MIRVLQMASNYVIIKLVRDASIFGQWVYAQTYFRDIPNTVYQMFGLGSNAKREWLSVTSYSGSPFRGTSRLCTLHYNDVIMSAMASQITSLTNVYPMVYSGADQRQHQSSASLAFVRVNQPVTGEVPAQRASNAENVSIWWRRHVLLLLHVVTW